MDRAAELKAIYADLKKKLKAADGSGAAALGLQLRLLANELDQLEQQSEVSRVDELASRRKSKPGAARPPARRRKSQ